MIHSSVFYRSSGSLAKAARSRVQSRLTKCVMEGERRKRGGRREEGIERREERGERREERGERREGRNEGEAGGNTKS